MKKFGWLLPALLLVWLAWQNQSGTAAPSSTSLTTGLSSLKIKNLKIAVELSDTPAKQQKGLSGRKALPKNQGMLFVFDEPAIYHFWMKGMRFPIDIIWIDENLKIMEITKNVSPFSFPRTFRSEQPVKYVLEIAAGLSKKHRLYTGDKIIFPYNRNE